jgi:hypothetical protein
MNYLIILLIPFFISPVSALQSKSPRSNGSPVIGGILDNRATLQKEILRLKQELDAALEELENKKMELSRVTGEFRQAKIRNNEVVDQLYKEIAELKAGASAEIERLKSEIDNLRTDQKQNQNEGVNKENLEQAQTTIASLEQQLATLHANNKNVNSLLEQIKALENANAQLTGKLAAQTNEFERVQRKLQELQTDYQSAITASEESEAKDAKIAELNALLETRHQENLELQRLIETLNAIIENQLPAIQLQHEHELQKVRAQALEENETLREELLKAQQTIEELQKPPAAPMPPVENKELNALRDQIRDLENQIRQREENEQEEKRTQELTLLREELAEKGRALQSASERAAGAEELERVLVAQNHEIQRLMAVINNQEVALYEFQRQAESQHSRKPTPHRNDPALTEEAVAKIIRTSSISDANNEKIEVFHRLAEENARDATRLTEELNRIERMHDEQTKSLRQSRQDALRKEQALQEAQQALNQRSAEYNFLQQALSSDNYNWAMGQHELMQNNHQMSVALEQQERALKQAQQKLEETKRTNEALRTKNSQLQEKLTSVKETRDSKSLALDTSPQDSTIIESYFEDKRIRLQAKTAKPYITNLELTKNYVERHEEFRNKLKIIEKLGEEMSNADLPPERHKAMKKKMKEDVNKEIVDLQAHMSYEAYLFNELYNQKPSSYKDALTSFITLWRPLLSIRNFNAKLGEGFLFNILSSPETKVLYEVAGQIGSTVPISRLIEFLSKKSGINIKDWYQS